MKTSDMDNRSLGPGSLSSFPAETTEEQQVLFNSKKICVFISWCIQQSNSLRFDFH
jgi:hypothetical protein